MMYEFDIKFIIMSQWQMQVPIFLSGTDIELITFFSAQLIEIFSEINIISQFSRIKPLKVVAKLVKKSGRIS